MTIEKNTPPWHINASQYCIQQGVKQPYICEISPMQMGLMSKRALDKYMTERGREWQASADCKQEWRRKVYAAFKAGEFQKGSPGLHSEAWDAVVSARIAEGEASRAEAWKEYEQANHITRPSDVSPGDRIYDLMCSCYVRVLKLFPKGIRVQPESPRYSSDPMKSVTRPARVFWRMSYDDAKEAFEAAYSSESTTP